MRVCRVVEIYCYDAPSIVKILTDFDPVSKADMAFGNVIVSSARVLKLLLISDFNSSLRVGGPVFCG